MNAVRLTPVIDNIYELSIVIGLLHSPTNSADCQVGSSWHIYVQQEEAEEDSDADKTERRAGRI